MKTLSRWMQMMDGSHRHRSIVDGSTDGSDPRVGRIDGVGSLVPPRCTDHTGHLPFPARRLQPSPDSGPRFEVDGLAQKHNNN